MAGQIPCRPAVPPGQQWPPAVPPGLQQWQRPNVDWPKADTSRSGPRPKQPRSDVRRSGTWAKQPPTNSSSAVRSSAQGAQAFSHQMSPEHMALINSIAARSSHERSEPPAQQVQLDPDLTQPSQNWALQPPVLAPTGIPLQPAKDAAAATSAILPWRFCPEAEISWSRVASVWSHVADVTSSFLAESVAAPCEVAWNRCTSLLFHVPHDGERQEDKDEVECLVRCHAAGITVVSAVSTATLGLNGTFAGLFLAKVQVLSLGSLTVVAVGLGGVACFFFCQRNALRPCRPAVQRVNSEVGHQLRLDHSELRQYLYGIYASLAVLPPLSEMAMSSNWSFLHAAVVYDGLGLLVLNAYVHWMFSVRRSRLWELGEMDRSHLVRDGLASSVCMLSTTVFILAYPALL